MHQCERLTLLLQLCLMFDQLSLEVSSCGSCGYDCAAHMGEGVMFAGCHEGECQASQCFPSSIRVLLRLLSQSAAKATMNWMSKLRPALRLFEVFVGRRVVHFVRFVTCDDPTALGLDRAMRGTTKSLICLTPTKYIQTIDRISPCKLLLKLCCRDSTGNSLSGRRSSSANSITVSQT